jgi:outer membrane protein assembly factor BamB
MKNAAHLLCCLLSVAAGCAVKEFPMEGDNDWPMLGRDPDRSGRTSEGRPVPPLAIGWQTDLGCAISASPSISGNRLYITGYDGGIHCLDTRSGAVLWSRPIGALPEDDAPGSATGAVQGVVSHSESTPAIGGGRVFAGAYNGWFGAWDAKTGRPLWRFLTGERRPGVGGWGRVQRGTDSSPCVVDGLVYFGAFDGFVYALRAEDGSLAWKHDAGDLVHWSSPAVAGGRLFIGIAGGRLIALDAGTGDLLWKRELCEPHVEHMMCGPSVDGEMVFSGAGWEGGFHALNAATGETIWSALVNGLVAGTPAVHGESVFCFTANRSKEGALYAFNKSTGKQLWAAPLGGSSACSPAVAGEIVFATTGGAPSGDSLFAVNAGDGSIIWRGRISDTWGSPAPAGGFLYVAGSDGTIAALKSGSENLAERRAPAEHHR